MDLQFIDKYSYVNKKINLETILKNFTNKKLKKIVNVYNLQLKNGKSPGLGDFLRGSFCFLQLAKLLNIEFEIDISNHPISKYVENSSPLSDIDYSNIIFYHEYNRNPYIKSDYEFENKILNLNLDFLDKTINWLNTQNCETFGFFSNAFPCFNIYKQYEKNIINSKLQPNKFMIKYIDDTLKELKLEKNGYGVLHIRTGDQYINNNNMDNNFINNIKNIIKNLIIKERRYLIISDSNYLKEHLNIFPNFYIMIKNIEHLGGASINIHNSDGIMNTLLEYYLMSYSNAIISLSVYNHVSGFSKYCAVLNNIPYKFIKINN